MTSLPVGFWAWWVILLTLGSLTGLVWLVWSSYFSKDIRVEPDAEGEQAPTVWDENLREGSRPAPMWWFWLILGLLVISVVYLMLYPGLGSFRGFFNWSAGGHLQERLESFDELFGPERDRILEMPMSIVQQDPELMQNAERIFARHCAACHGRRATGQANRFPNLNDEEWLWGGSIEDIETTIREGRTAIMAGWGESFTEEQIDYLVDYVVVLGQGEPVDEHPASQLYNMFCVTCHLSDGSGESAVGAPDLRNSIYLYGSDRPSIKYTIAMGRNGEMPGFGEILDDLEIHLLIAWITRPR